MKVILDVNNEESFEALRLESINMSRTGSMLFSEFVSISMLMNRDECDRFWNSGIFGLNKIISLCGIEFIDIQGLSAVNTYFDEKTVTLKITFRCKEIRDRSQEKDTFLE